MADTVTGTPTDTPPATDMAAVVRAIVVALGEVLDSDLPEVTVDTRLFDELGLDSTSVLEMLMRLEEELSMEFDPDTLEQHHFETAGTLGQYVLEQAGR